MDSRSVAIDLPCGSDGSLSCPASLAPSVRRSQRGASRHPLITASGQLAVLGSGGRDELDLGGRDELDLGGRDAWILVAATLDLGGRDAWILVAAMNWILVAAMARNTQSAGNDFAGFSLTLQCMCREFPERPGREMHGYARVFHSL
jgi:hypothetical protein